MAIRYYIRVNLIWELSIRTGMQLVPASASGCAGDGGPPRHGRGGRAGAGPGGPAAGGGSASRGGPRAGGGSAGPDDRRAGDLSQEEILDLVVEAMLARGGPAGEDDDLADGGGDAGGGWEPWDAPGPGEAGGQDCGPAGFGSGRSFDVLRPGPVLAGAADRVHTGALRRVSDEELTGMIRAWRRLSSWATARELGAIAEFARRRPDEDPGPGMDGDVARRVRARRAASGPPGAAGQAGSAQAPPAGGVNPAAQAAQPGGVNPAAEAGQPGGASPAAEAGQPGGASPAAEAAQPGGVNPAAEAAPAAPAPRLAGRAGQPRQRRLLRLPLLAG